MAFDKVADSVALDTELKSLADILREKSETTEELDFYAGDFSRVAESIEFIGVKLSNFDDERKLPKTADARSFDLFMPNLSEDEHKSANASLTSLFACANTNAGSSLFSILEEVYLPLYAAGVTSTFLHCARLKKIYGDLPYVTQTNCSFENCWALENVPYMPNLEEIWTRSFSNCKTLTRFIMPPKVTSIHTTAFNGCDSLTDIYCPWAEGAVANAPWGATNATIHYNTQYDENGNPITE